MIAAVLRYDGQPTPSSVLPPALGSGAGGWRAAGIARRRPTGACGEALRSLDGHADLGRFRAWTGCSGRRYVVSVFEAGAHAADLPLDGGAVVLLVGRDAAGNRHLQGGVVMDPGETAPALDADVEIHLHLLAAGAAARRAALADIMTAAGQAVARSAPSSRNPPDWRCHRSA